MTPSTETIRIEAVFMTGQDEIAEFQGRVIEHHIPRDRMDRGAGGDIQWSIIPGEYVVLDGAPPNFDPRITWNRITAASLNGFREVTGAVMVIGAGRIRVGLKRLRIPNP